jgi:hypothetical protein
MLTIENTHKLLNSMIVKNTKVEYYVFNTTKFAGAYQIHLRCPRKSKSDELLLLLRTSDIFGPNNETTYTMYDNSNPMNRIYLRIVDISDMNHFRSSIEFLVNKYILC